MIRTCWELGKLPEFADLKLWKWAHMLGFRGHFSTKSRCYSVILGALRDARRAWRTEQARAQAGLPDLDPTTTLVLGHWSYLGSGYSPGTALLAAHVWSRRELERQFAAEDDRACARRAPPGAEYAGGATDGSPGNGTAPARPVGRLRLAPHSAARLDHSLGRARRIPTHALTDFIRARLDQEAA